MSEFALPSLPVAPPTDTRARSSLQSPPRDAETLRKVGQEFEAAFMAEMLRHSGVGKMPSTFNGGPGEAAFTDFLTREYAETIARSQSVDIADRVYQSLSERMLP